jgi:two-component system response regulator YesN
VDYVKQVVKQKRLSPSEFRTLLNNIIFNVSLELRSLKAEGFDLGRERLKYLQQVNQIESAAAGRKVLKDFVAAVQSNLLGISAEKDQENICLIIDFIKNNFDQPLSLSSVAQHFHFNSSYLSTYFSNHYPEGFNEYLNKIRVKESVFLLGSTRKTISEIGINVGYSDHSYFCKVFKKIMGMSPSAYRKSLS